MASRRKTEGRQMTGMTFEEHLDALAVSGRRLADRVSAVPPTTAVPTCPQWTVTDLLAHQAMVHRWATAHVTGGDPDTVPRHRALAEQTSDLLGYYSEGLDTLIAGLRAAPADLRAMTFLKDAPPPRDFWARRQAHETTIHSVDAVAAALGQVPRADEIEPAIGADLAADGIDELLCGFVTRGRSRVAVERPVLVQVRPTDADDAWSVRIGATVETARDTSDEPADAVFHGSAAQLYVGLWNRGDEIAVDGDASLLEAWRGYRVRWS